MTQLSDYVRVYIADSSDPWAVSPSFTELTSLSSAEAPLRGVRQVDVRWRRANWEGGQFTARSLTVDLNNHDGDFDTINPGAVWSASDLTRNRLVKVEVSDDTFSTHGDLFYGFLDDVQPFGTALYGYATLTAQDMFRPLGEYDLDSVTRPAELTGVRVAAILDEVGVPAHLRGTIDNGTQMMPATTLTGSALQLLRRCARAEFGVMYCGESGNFNFRDRYVIFSKTTWTTRQHSLNADGTSGASAIFARPIHRPNSSRSFTRNTASGASGETFEYDETPANFPPVNPSTPTVGLELLYDADTRTMAEAAFKAWEYSTQRMETVPVRVVPGNPNALTAISNGRYEPLTRIEVQATPSGNTTDFNFEARIEGAHHRMNKDGIWDCLLTLSPWETQRTSDSSLFAEYGTGTLSGKRGAL